MRISDKDIVILEGTVIGTPFKSVAGDKLALNFTIETLRSSPYGEKMYTHNVVVWNKLAEEMESKIVNGAYVSGRGHLQSQKLSYKDIESGEIKTLDFDKCCFDFIEVES
jgi:single-stranded DNA-binding protein